MAQRTIKCFILSVSFATFVGCTEQKVIFRDNFRNNKHRWQLISDEEFYVEIANKAISFQKKTKNRINNYCLWYEKTIPKFNTARDFIISFEAEIISADDVSNGFDFQWGKKDEMNDSTRIKPVWFQLDFSLDRIRLAKFNNGWEYYNQVYYKKADSLFQLKYGMKYRYEIIQKDKIVSVKINDVIVYSKEIEPIAGQSIGVQQCLKGQWRMSKLRILQL